MRKRLPPKCIRVHEDERHRIAQQLQEGLCRMLFAVKIKAALAQSMDDPAGRSVVLSELQTLVDETMEQGRRLACELSPQLPTTLGPRGSLDRSAEQPASGFAPTHRGSWTAEVGSTPASGSLALSSGRRPLLNDREREVLRLVAEGQSSDRIGRILSISRPAVSRYRISIRLKLGLRGVAQLTRYAVAAGLTSLNE